METRAALYPSAPDAGHHGEPLPRPSRAPTCTCKKQSHTARLMVLTGGPGAGKTAVLEVVRRSFCEHIAVLPEAAGIVFGGGFPRRSSTAARRAAQRAIWRVQRALEELVVGEGNVAVALCDRGTLDGEAYWPGPESLCEVEGTTARAELARYSAVIHLRSPPADGGYNHVNPLRIESAEEARAIDDRIFAAWAEHPHRVVIDSTDDFITKLAAAVSAIRAELPACCRTHPVPGLDALA
jgi:hypothetical protein